MAADARASRIKSRAIDYADKLVLLFHADECSLMGYRQTSNISFTKSQNFNVSCLVLQLPLHNPSKPGVKSKTKM